MTVHCVMVRGAIETRKPTKRFKQMKTTEAKSMIFLKDSEDKPGVHLQVRLK